VKISVQLFAVARDKAGRATIDLLLPDSATVADVRAALAKECPALSPLLSSIRIAVNSEYAADSHRLTENAEVALIPPVSGG
jgi:molybdopterin converting factor subunit 1